MAAIDEVRSLLAAKVTALNYTALLDRDELEPASIEDCPAVLIEEDGAQIERFEGIASGTVFHRGKFMLTCCARVDGATSAREGAYAIMAAVMADLLTDFSLGDNVQEVIPTGYGPAPGGNDIYAIAIDLDIVFATSTTDFDTLI